MLVSDAFYEIGELGDSLLKLGKDRHYNCLNKIEIPVCEECALVLLVDNRLLVPGPLWELEFVHGAGAENADY